MCRGCKTAGWDSYKNLGFYGRINKFGTLFFLDVCYLKFRSYIRKHITDRHWEERWNKFLESQR